ncbi:MAG TPA: hypothetical protein VGF84_05045 [Micromonosporaceae bacterium]|jgi:hypothetical protein
MPTSPKPKPAQHDPRVVVTANSNSTPRPANESLRALQMSMDTRQ